MRSFRFPVLPLVALIVATIASTSLGAQSVSLTPDGGSLNALTGSSSQPASFTIQRFISGNGTYYMFCYPSGNVTSCAPNQSSYTIPPNIPIPIGATFAVGAVGTGVVTLKACDNPQCTQGQDYGSYNVTVVPYGVAVTALRDTAPSQAQFTTGFTTQFTVTNKTAATESLTLSCQSSTTVSCSSISPTSITNLASGASATVTVTYQTLAAGWGWVQLTATGGSSGGSDLAGLVVVPYKVTVTPDAKNVGAVPSASRTQQFTIQNLTSSSVTYTFSVLCTGAGVSNCSQPSSQSVPAGSSATANVNYTSSATLGSTGRVRLQASGTPDQDSGWVNVTIASAMAPDTVDVTNTMPGTRVEPQICLTLAASRGAAYQCGDLRIVHPLPTTRTMNKARTPALVYGSQYAHPYPLIAATVSLSASAATPDSVVATLRISPSNAVHGRSRYDGADWIPGRASRIVVIDTTLVRVGPKKDTVYSYTLEVVNFYDATPASRSTSGTFAVVDRSASPFGAGWWLAGLERLDVATKVWTSGDGALRQYSSAGTDRWAAATLARPDTLKWDGTNYIRILPHGVTVRFDAQGRHVATVNRLGHQTTFGYDSCDRLQSITLPPTGSGRVYTFAYANPSDCTTKLQTVTAPSIGSTSRVTTLTVVNRRVTAIQDPGSTTVNFAYGTGADTNRIVSRTDRRGTVTSFTYDVGKKLSRSSIANGVGWPPIQNRYRTAQSYGLPGAAIPSAIDTALVYTRVDAPRLDVGDTTIFWENRFSAPYRIVNALGNETRLAQADSRWPALVTRLSYPNGRVLGAVYDDRGNLLSSTDSSTFLNGQYATTTYAWNSKWDFVTKIIPPERDSLMMAYSDSNGNRIWQQDGRGALGQTDFLYYTDDSVRGLLRSVRTPSQLLSSPRDSMIYNALGNLAGTKPPSGFWTIYRKDNVGRDTLVLAPVLLVAPDTLKSLQSVTYDLFDRVTQVRSVGPQLSYYNPVTATDSLTKPESLWVATFYNAEGLPDSVRRWSRPNWNGINTLTTKWSYDPAGRRVREAAPDGAVDSTLYDRAGNVIKNITRRGHTITLTYDAMNRLTKRVLPTVTYPVWHPYAWNEIWTFPYFRPDASGGLTVFNNTNASLTIASDTETFTYDVMGNILSADNSAARIRRGYNLNGALAGDTLIVLPYVGTDTMLHRYGLQFTYDRNGRRTVLQHPNTIAPLVQGVVKDQQRYRYDATIGVLDSVIDAIGNAFDFTYDVENRVSQLVQGAFRVTYEYNADGRLYIRKDSLLGGSLLHSDTLFYDARDKIIRTRTAGDTTRLTYTGLGSLAWSSSYQFLSEYPLLHPSERHVPDALGNLYETTHHQGTGSSTPLSGFDYQVTTGRLLKAWQAPYRTDPHTAEANKTYDAAGSIYRADGSRNTVAGGQSGQLVDRTASYYDAAGRLRVIDRQACFFVGFATLCDGAIKPEYNDRSAFEEYRYDAVGRRVLVRTRTEVHCLSGARCRNAITRVVWDGDQILYEISSNGATSATATELEKDTGQVVQQGQGVSYFPYGRVVYTHGAALDAPLGLLRMNYSNIFPEPILVLPTANWQGQYDLGTIAGSKSPVSPDTVGYCRHNPPPNGPLYCFVIDWPAPFMWQTLHSRSRGDWGPRSWNGSLIETGRDASGQMYRRNRYYDPATGRFTQEDPVGLAGGLNLYGFAAGDPVNFGDPFGLKVCFKGPHVGEAKRATEQATGSSIELDKQNCIKSITATSSDRGLSILRSRLKTMTRSPIEFGVRIFDGISPFKAGGPPHTDLDWNVHIGVDAADAFGNRYGSWTLGPNMMPICLPAMGKPSNAAFVAHELLGHLFSQYAAYTRTGSAASGVGQDYAVRAENYYHGAAGEIPRCGD